MFKPVLTNSTVFSLTLIGIGLGIISILSFNIVLSIISICLIVLPLYISNISIKRNTYRELDKQINKTDLKVGYAKIGEKKI